MPTHQQLTDAADALHAVEAAIHKAKSGKPRDGDGDGILNEGDKKSSGGGKGVDAVSIIAAHSGHKTWAPGSDLGKLQTAAASGDASQIDAILRYFPKTHAVHITGTKLKEAMASGKVSAGTTPRPQPTGRRAPSPPSGVSHFRVSAASRDEAMNRARKELGSGFENRVIDAHQDDFDDDKWNAWVKD